jgi:hypothetical protein
MRALNQKGVRYGYFQTTPMARLLPEAAASGTLVAAALARAAGRLPPSRGIGAEAAARAVGYEELGPGERRRSRVKVRVGSARARLLRLRTARLVALGGSAFTGRAVTGGRGRAGGWGGGGV